MPGRKRRSKRRHRIVKACLMESDYIHISLAQQQLRLLCHPRKVQPEQVAALVKNRGLRRVQILRLAVSHYTSTEPDHFIMYIHNREHGTVPELIVASSSLINCDKPGFF